MSGILAALLGFSLMLVIIKRSQKYFSRQQQELGGLNGQVEETYSGHTVVKLFNGEEAEKKQFAGRNERLYQCAWKSQFMAGLMPPLMAFVGNLSYVVVCVVGAVLTMMGKTSFGTVLAFMIYIRLFTQPMQNLSQAASSMQSMAAACERVFDFLGEEEMEEESGKAKHLST